MTSTRGEPVNAITKEDCKREGFPDMTPAEFIEFFCGYHKILPTKIINRIEWEYLKRKESYACCEDRLIEVSERGCLAAALAYYRGVLSYIC